MGFYIKDYFTSNNNFSPTEVTEKLAITKGNKITRLNNITRFVNRNKYMILYIWQR